MHTFFPIRMFEAEHNPILLTHCTAFGFHATQKKKSEIPRRMPNKLSIDVWGPCAWNFLHAVSFSYPHSPKSSERQQMYEFVMSIGKVLPCKLCCTHFSEMMTKYLVKQADSAPFDSRENLARFLVDAHNQVNRRLHKREYGFEAVRDDYLFASTRSARPWIILLLIVALLVCIVWYCTSRRGGRHRMYYDTARRLNSYRRLS